MFMATLLGGIFLFTVGIILVSSVFMQAQLAPLLVGIENNAELSMIIIGSSVVSFLLSVALLIVLFLLMETYITKPVRVITVAMKTFAETGQKPNTASGWAPKEVRSLVDVFTSFTGSVEEVHAHDMEVSRVKSDFISTAAHQLRTPLTGIRWALEALQMEQLTEPQKVLVANAVEKSHQLVAVVGTLLDISSIESGKYKYDFKVTSLDGLVDEITRDFQTLAGTSKVPLLFEKTGEPSARVNIDSERIRWVLNNLVENAIRYTPEGGSVRVTTEVTQNRAYVHVRDTGIGIAPEDRGNIFERFYRAPNAITKQNNGNGLGLYIARTVAKDHGGDLGFRANDADLGTTFTLSLPLSE
jgi:signal transduction histidine kinase